jgi:hypothetical protein
VQDCKVAPRKHISSGGVCRALFTGCGVSLCS